MKKSTIAIPVAIALLSFGLSTQSMALEIKDVVVPVATGVDSVAVGVNDTLNDNELLSDNELKDIGNKEEAAVDDGKFNAVANNGSKAEVELDKSVNIKDINLAVLKSEVKGQVKDNYLSFGKDLDQKSIGNSAEADNKSLQININDQHAKSFQINKSDQDVKQFQVNKEAAFNAALGANKQTGINPSDQTNVPVGVNVPVLSADDQTGINKADAENEALGLNKADAENKALQANKQGDQKNAALGANKSHQDNKALVANNSDLANTTTQNALADAGSYTSTQTQTVSLTTGNNILKNFSANGVNPIAMNTGVQSLIQQSANVQANLPASVPGL